MSAARPPLLSIEDARARVIARSRVIKGVENVPLARARGRVLARDLVSVGALPAFDQSAMDGYALALAPDASTYRIVGRVAAGHAGDIALQPGEAARIFTGAPLPRGADAVALQEHVVIDGAGARLTRPVAAGDNIRPAGEDARSGERLVVAGAMLDARHIGLAAAAGFATLPVTRPLRVALASTGDELVEPGGLLAPGLIYDANRPLLRAALERPAIVLEDFGALRDNFGAVTRFFADARSRVDLIVTTGGASVGDEDHLSAALAAAGGAIDVAHVAIRPGKPFTHGHVGNAAVAILPGNPFAAFVAALLFVRPMIERSLGSPVAPFAPLRARAGFDQPRPLARVEFLPARIVDRAADGAPILERLGRGGSARLLPLIAADGLAVVAPGETPVARGDAVGYLPFGTAFSL